MERLTGERQRQLLEQVRTGGRQGARRALEVLLEDFRPPAMAAIYKTLAACNLPSSGAEEVLQEAILKFMGPGLRSFRGDAAPRTYFVRIAINCSLDAARRAARLDPLPEEHPRLTEEAPSAEERLSARQLRAALQRCLEQIPEAYRRSVQLYYLEEAGDCAACGQELGVSGPAFMQRLSRARAMLAECIRRRTR